ncbi:MAG: M23 family metallopeptidase [Clostridia bacterium]|nr:M23 family metallopeptidase [Clostridia bacterium]
MKKAYVKVKTPSSKTVLKRPYIAVSIISAAICAIVLSVMVNIGQVEIEKEPEMSAVSTPDVKEPVINVPKEIELPPITEVETPKTSETELNEESTEDEGVSVGLFGKTEEILISKPVEGEIMKAFSGTKPVKSKTMGDWRIHSGVDIAAEKGTKVTAIADGKVIKAKKDSLTGHTITIEHKGGLISTVYNLESSDGVSEGQQVKEGDILGTVGESAASEMSEGPHVHLELSLNGEFLDPEEYFK